MLLIFLLVTTVYSLPTGDEVTPRHGETCGYDSCTEAEAGVLNIHIVPHTHDDVGWLKTVDQYYYGSRNYIQTAGVQYILDTVVQELWLDPKRRFIYVETAFFWKWWTRQTDSIKHKVHTLVRQGRLQFVGGAWSMNDEAATHYQSTVDQFTWGLSKLNETFGHCGRPHVGWQIDPFGHSREFAAILAESGFDGLMLGRIDYQDKQNRFSTKTAEYLWRGRDMEENSDIFSGVMFNTYSPPPGFCFDIVCSDEPIIDDIHSPMYNVDKKISDFFAYTQVQADSYKTNNIIITMGGDFTYQDAATWYNSLDKLIKYGNLKAGQDGLKIKLFYSTPNCYVKAVKDSKPTLPIKQDDFFPYASDQHAFWTGYFTSRPTIKFFERQGNSYLQMAKQLQVIAGLEEHNKFILDELKSAMGVMQHHDAITGTEKQHVTFDYERILDNAIDDSLIITRQAFNKINQRDANKTPVLTYDRCKFNESQCFTSENSENFIVTVYNPLGHILDGTPIRIPVQDGKFTVIAPNGFPIANQLVKLPEFVRNIPTRTSNATHELVFIAKNVKPMGVKSFYISKSNKIKRDTKKGNLDGNDYWKDDMIADEPLTVERYPDDIYLGSSTTQLRINNTTGEVTHIKINNKEEPFNIQLLYYPGYLGDNSLFEKRASGAYIFRPNSTNPYKIDVTLKDTIKGVIVDEAHYTSDYYSVIVRIYNTLGVLEIDWVAGPIDISDSIGKELIIRYSTNIDNKNEFYTDSNGRQMLKRTLNYRPQWNLTLLEPVSGNYYPITNRIYIQDGAKRLSVLTDRAEGGSCLNNGEIEVMLHRRLLNDDGFGVGEALNEIGEGKGLVVRGKHRILLTDTKNEVSDRLQVLKKHLEPQLFVSNAKNVNLEDWLTMNNCFGGVKANLTQDIHILTVEPYENKLLLRLENINPENSANIDLKSIFTTIKVKAFKETALSADRYIDEVDKWTWLTNDEFLDDINSASINKGKIRPKVQDNGYVIGLKANQIRTFIVDYDYDDK